MKAAASAGKALHSFAMKTLSIMKSPWHYASVTAVLIIVLTWHFWAEDLHLSVSTFDRNKVKLSFHAFNLTGRAFDTTLVTYLEDFDLLEAVTDPLPPLSANWTPVFVTAASSDHFLEMRGALHSMWSRYPNATFVVYDIGLNAKQSAEAANWCNVEFKKFDFDRYPAHFRAGKKYAWKVAIIAEQLQTKREFFWIDASARLRCGDLSVFPTAVRNGTVEPFLMFRDTPHSIFAATHPGMYEYFPQVNLEFLKAQKQKASGLLFVSDSSYTRELVKWALLCALTEDCIHPLGAKLTCKFTDAMNAYAGCHRYDQSLYALLRTQMLFLDGFHERFDGTTNYQYDSESLRRNRTVPSLENFRQVASEWDKRIAPFDACLYPARGNRYTGALPQCAE